MEAADTPSPSLSPVVLFDDGTVRVWGCQSLSQGLGTNRRMVMALASDTMWSNPGNCSVTNDTTACTSNPPHPVNVHVVQNFTWNTSSVYGVYYECNNGWYLASGSPGLLTQCVASTWTSFSENCVPAPRDCCGMSVNNPGIYGVLNTVIKVGNNISGSVKKDSEGHESENNGRHANQAKKEHSPPHIHTRYRSEKHLDTNEIRDDESDQVYKELRHQERHQYQPMQRFILSQVMCDMGSEPGSYEGGWTLVLWHSIQSPNDLKLDIGGYTQGYGQPLLDANHSYFIGLEYLVALNWNNNTVRPLVMKVLMMDTSNNMLHATYGSVVINRDSMYTLNSLGNYHGNAGNYLSGSVGRTFCGDGGISDSCWWGDPLITGNVAGVGEANEATSSEEHSVTSCEEAEGGEDEKATRSEEQSSTCCKWQVIPSNGRSIKIRKVKREDLKVVNLFSARQDECTSVVSEDKGTMALPPLLIEALLTGNVPTWGSSSLYSVKVWVRSRTCDDALACPPMNTFNLPDESMVPLSRAPNTTFPYSCVGDLMMASKVDGTKSLAGQVTCLPASNGSPPKWDTVFPCVRKVLQWIREYLSEKQQRVIVRDDVSEWAPVMSKDPQGFLIYYYKLKKILLLSIFNYGSHSYVCVCVAFLRMLDGVAFLRMLDGVAYLRMLDGVAYLRMLDGVAYLRMLDGVAYLRMLDGVGMSGSCPPGYTLYNSRCYKMINKSPFTSFLDALDTCNRDGAALPYPKDNDTLNYLVKFAQSKVIWNTATTVQLATGFTNIWDNLTVNNIYAPSNDVVAAVQSLVRSANSNCTFLSVTKNSAQWVLTPASINSTFTYAICEFRGPLVVTNTITSTQQMITPMFCCWESAPYYENFSVNGNLPGNTINQNLNYSCWPGYYVNGVVGSEWSQYLWCYGQLGGWFPRHPPLDPCIGIDVCNETFPPAPPGIVMTPDTNPRYKTHKLNYNCAANGMSNLVGQSSQKLVCTKYNESYYNYVGPNITECQRCFSGPRLYNANTTTLSSEVWTIGEQVNVTCDPGYQVSHNVSTQVITCTNNSWQYQPCQKVCLEVPVVRNATTDWVDNMWTVNEKVTATCKGNLYFALLKSKTRSVNCTDTGWDDNTGCDEGTTSGLYSSFVNNGYKTTRNLPHIRHLSTHQSCVEDDHYVSIGAAHYSPVCRDDAVVVNATVDLQGKYWLVGSTVPAVCNANHMFLQEENNTVPIMCTSLGWENRTGCALVCEAAPNLQQANTNWNSTGIYPVGSTVNATCLSGYLLPGGGQEYQVECTDSGWNQVDMCKKVFTALENCEYYDDNYKWELCSCLDEPRIVNGTTNYTSSGVWLVGSFVYAVCQENFTFTKYSSSSRRVNCTLTGWDNTPPCQESKAQHIVYKVMEIYECELSTENVTTSTNEALADENESTSLEIPTKTIENFTKNSSSEGKGVVPTYPCNVPPVVTNANTSWINKTWTTGERVIVTCLNSSYFSDFTQQQQLQCVEGGWENITGCQKPSIAANIVDKCSIQPVVENATVAWVNRTWVFGSNVTATCISGYMFVAENVTELPIMCTDNGWQNQTGCQAVCMGEPSVEGANIDVSARVWLVGDTVNATCLPGLYLLPDGSQSQLVECLKEGWQNVTACEEACVEEPDYENANWVWNHGVWKAGESLPANCTDQHLTEDGVTNTSFTCTSNGWLIESPCLKVCEGEPVVNNATTTWTSGMWLEGKQVTAKCKPHNHFSPKVIYFPLTFYSTICVNYFIRPCIVTVLYI
ncbi:uncharacterized protein [Cherax quadricarinatus]|uniref:uncharacterized protein n=1 Tax=Cherax quadricarinatus TaxID=27406 RepID=UPI00387E8F0B